MPAIVADRKKPPHPDIQGRFVARPESTLAAPVSISGVGLFTGENVVVRFLPAPSGSGIAFRRVDLPGKPLIPATVDHVLSTPRCTILGTTDASVQTVEHVMAAITASGIENLMIEINGSELPVLDGAAQIYVQLFDKVGLHMQEGAKKIYQLETPLYYSHRDTHIVALPAEEYRISYTLHYPNSPFIGAQFYSVEVTKENFIEQIAPCRTFSLYEEILLLMEKGMLKGGNLENSVVIKDNRVLNPDGLKFPDELVRHKVLDMIGDLALGDPVLAHIIAIKGGHASNHAFAKLLRKRIQEDHDAGIKLAALYGV